MVQMDVTALTLGHFQVAAQTGALTAIAYYVTLMLGIRFPYMPVFLTGLFTAVADIIVHPTHFGPEWMEALVTGLGAMFLAFVYERVKTNVRL